MTHFARDAGTCQFERADVDEGALAWCADHLDHAKFTLLPKRPPSPFPDAHFDAIYAFSVFSHLPERVHRLWLEDLFRIARPGAVIVLTVQGRRVIDAMIARRDPDDVPSFRQLLHDAPDIERAGFAFYPYRQLTFADPMNQQHFDAWDLEKYGSTFILDSYFGAKWTDLFHVVSWHAAPDGWQDYVILRRRPGRPLV